MQIDPKIGLYAAAVMAVVAGVATGIIPLPDTVSVPTAEHVKSWAVTLSACWTVLSGVLFGLSSDKPGPFVPPSKP